MFDPDKAKVIDANWLHGDQQCAGKVVLLEDYNRVVKMWRDDRDLIQHAVSVIDKQLMAAAHVTKEVPSK